MSSSTKLKKKVKELEEKAILIKQLGTDLIKNAPLKYSIASSGDVLVIGVSDYHWKAIEVVKQLIIRTKGNGKG
ncbi:hypothetical protein LCGC14_1396300 [marine sediment metagenome]|uniref:Uncharacterized protein n=1 Tax=marine sediment metagenome TaxID=412755 RepID=A0A0F9JYN4_9ZZZZ